MNDSKKTELPKVVDLAKFDPNNEVYLKDLKMFNASNGGVFVGLDEMEVDTFYDKDMLVPGSRRLALLNENGEKVMIFETENKGYIRSNKFDKNQDSTKQGPIYMDAELDGRLREVSEEDLAMSATSDFSPQDSNDARSLLKHVMRVQGKLKNLRANSLDQEERISFKANKAETTTFSEIKKLIRLIENQTGIEVKGEQKKLRKFELIRNNYNELFQ